MYRKVLFFICASINVFISWCLVSTVATVCPPLEVRGGCVNHRAAPPFPPPPASPASQRHSDAPVSPLHHQTITPEWC